MKRRTADARARLVTTTVGGLIAGCLCAAWTGNLLAIAGGLLTGLGIEVTHLAIQSHRRRQLRPVVRREHSHVRRINAIQRESAA